MCGRFVQSMTREDYIALLSEEAERNIPYGPEPIGRLNVDFQHSSAQLVP